jgi:hypothetical protein
MADERQKEFQRRVVQHMQEAGLSYETGCTGIKQIKVLQKQKEVAGQLIDLLRHSL